MVVVVVVVVSSGTVIGILCGGGVSSISKPSRPGRNESAERVVSQGGRGLGVVDVVVLVVSEKLRCQPKLFRFRGSVRECRGWQDVAKISIARII